MNLLNYNPIMYKIYSFYFLKKHTQQKVTTKKSQSVCMRCWRIKHQPLPALWFSGCDHFKPDYFLERTLLEDGCLRMTSFPFTLAQAQRSFWKKKKTIFFILYILLYWNMLLLLYSAIFVNLYCNGQKHFCADLAKNIK